MSENKDLTTNCQHDNFMDEEAMLDDFFKRNGNKLPNVDEEYEKFRQKHVKPRMLRRAMVAVASVAAAVVVAIGLATAMSGDAGSDTQEPLVAYSADSSVSTDIVLRQGGGKDQVIASSAAYKSVTARQRGKTTMCQLSTHNGKTFSLILDDGTEVWLNANSRLVFPNSFGKSLRRVEVYGEAYFSVAKDARRPFVVEANGVTAKVLGTEFNVNAYDAASVAITLVEGSLEVSSNEGKRRIEPGEQALIDKSGVNVTAIDTYPITAWQRGEFYFDNMTLLDVAREVGKWYNVSVVFNNREMANRRIYLTADRTAPIEEVAESIAVLGRVKINITKGLMTVE